MVGWADGVCLVWYWGFVVVGGVGLAVCGDGVLGCFQFGGRQMPSTFISVFLHGRSFTALNQGQNC